MTDISFDEINFYKQIISILIKSQFSFMIGGGLAVKEYAPLVSRPMNDLDIFVKGGDYPKIITLLQNEDYKIAIKDERWLAQIKKGKAKFDLIFSSPNYINVVDDSWIVHAHVKKIFGMQVKMIAPEELIWAKAYVQDRTHYDGADINHIILCQGKHLDWKRLLMRMENHWELLLGLLINFRFVYPSKRGMVPKWLMEELILRLQNQLTNPIPQDKISRGPLLSRTQYQDDIQAGGFQSIT